MVRLAGQLRRAFARSTDLELHSILYCSNKELSAIDVASPRPANPNHDGSSLG